MLRDAQRAAQQAEREAKRLEIQERRKQEIAAREQACENIRGWLGKSPLPNTVARPSGATANAAVIALIQDDRFMPFFGKTYDQLTREELLAYSSRILGYCFGMPNGPLASMSPTDKRAAIDTLSTIYFPINVRTLNDLRQAQRELEKLAEQADGLQVTEADYLKFKEIQNTAAGLLARLPDAKHTRYQTAVAAAEQRIVIPVESERVRKAVEEAHGYEGALALVRLDGEFGSTVSSTALERARASNREMIRAKLSNIGSGLLDIERQRVDALGTGLVGLERGVQWSTEFNSRYREMFPYLKGSSAALRYFQDKRLALMGGAYQDLVQRISSARSNVEIEEISRRYLLREDFTTVPGSAVATAITNQRAELEKRAVLGRRLEEERAALARKDAAPTGSRASAASAAPAAARGGDLGEPSEETMFELVKAQVDAVSKGPQAEGCDSRERMRNDPGLALLCMGAAMNRSANSTHGPMRITKFEKLGCAKSRVSGYSCEYILGLTGGSISAMGAMGGIVSKGEVVRRRFVQTQNGWLMFNE